MDSTAEKKEKKKTIVIKQHSFKFYSFSSFIPFQISGSAQVLVSNNK